MIHRSALEEMIHRSALFNDNELSVQCQYDIQRAIST